jgi:PAS domain S-box-containing protein
MFYSIQSIQEQMVNIDFRTIYFSYFITTIVCLVVLAFLWNQNKKVFNGIGYLLIDFGLLSLGLILIFLRGKAPDFVSMVVSNFLSMLGVLLGLVGLQKLVGIRSKHYLNLVLLALFAVVHTYFALVNPNLALRNLNTSAIFLIFSAQYIWLMLVKVPQYMKTRTLPIGLIFIGFFIVNAIRVIGFFTNAHETNDYFHTGAFEIGVILLYQILFMFFTYFLVLFINKQLLTDNELQKEKFSKAFHASPFAMILTRMSDGKIYEVNKGFVKLTGYRNLETINQTTFSLKLWPNPTDRKTFINSLHQNERVTEMEFKFRRKSGEMFNGLISSEILTIENEPFAISAISDITDRKKAETQLKQYATDLKLANDTKDKLFSIIGHDLRSPFNSIIGFSELIRDEVETLDKETIKAYANTVNSSAIYTQNLFQNLLEWAKLQQGAFSFQLEECFVATVVAELKELFMGTALKKKISINNCVEEGLCVHADSNMLKTVIRNLVSNSIKYTPTGGTITIDAQTTEQEVVISVVDNGIGIDEQTLTALFKPGIQSKPGTEKEKGTGLGLLLCKEFIELHGGCLGAESELGKGSTFSFTLPFCVK